MDEYQQPNGVLRNRLGKTTHEDLKVAEARLTAMRTATLATSGAYSQQGFERLQAIHRHVFQDVYEWAGQARTTDLGKAAFEGDETVTRFTPAAQLEPEARRIFAQAAEQNHFKGLDRPTFAERAADHFAAVNTLHPFREGNGRAQVAYISRLAEEAGHPLDFRGVSRERMVSVSIDASRGEPGPMRRMFDELSDPSRARPLGVAADFLEANRATLGADWREHYLSTTTPGRQYTGQFLVADGERKHFIMLERSPDRFTVGNVKDLPNAGAGLRFQEPVAFTASMTPEQKAQRWVDDVTRSAPRGLMASTLEAEARNLANEAAPGAATSPARSPFEAREILPHVEAVLSSQVSQARVADQMARAVGLKKSHGLDVVR